jgi:hypothetical protein
MKNPREKMNKPVNPAAAGFFFGTQCRFQSGSRRISRLALLAQ